MQRCGHDSPLQEETGKQNSTTGETSKITGEVGPEKPVQSWIDRIGMSPAGLPFLLDLLCTVSYMIANRIK